MEIVRNKTHGIFKVIWDMYPYAYRLTDNNDDALDLLQDANLRVLKNMDKIPAAEKEYGYWVSRVIKNIFISKCLAAKSRLEYFKQLQPEGAVDLYLEFTRIENHDLIDIILGHIKTFKPHHQTIFGMAIDGYKYEEISKTINKKIGTVKSIIHLCRKEVTEFTKQL